MHYSTLKYYIAWQLQNMFNFSSPIFILLLLNPVSFKSSDQLTVKISLEDCTAAILLVLRQLFLLIIRRVDSTFISISTYLLLV